MATKKRARSSETLGGAQQWDQRQVAPQKTETELMSPLLGQALTLALYTRHSGSGVCVINYRDAALRFNAGALPRPDLRPTACENYSHRNASARLSISSSRQRSSSSRTRWDGPPRCSSCSGSLVDAGMVLNVCSLFPPSQFGRG
jgi:hypothetical protein